MLAGPCRRCESKVIRLRFASCGLQDEQDDCEERPPDSAGGDKTGSGPIQCRERGLSRRARCIGNQRGSEPNRW